MADKPSAIHTLGLEIDSQTLKGAQLGLRKGQPILVRLFELPFTAGSSSEHVKPLYTTEDGKALLNALPKNLVVTTLNASEVLVRQIEVKLKKISDIDDVLAFQAEPLLPYPAENAILDRQILQSNPEGTALTVFAARKDHIQQHLQLWNGIGVEPEVISCAPAALAAFAKIFSPSETLQIVVHISHASTLCILEKEGKLLAAQASFQGIDSLLEAHTKDVEESGVDIPFAELDFTAIKKETHPALVEVFDALRLEITRTLYALSKQTKGQNVEKILFTGEFGGASNLPKILSQQLNKPLAEPVKHSGFSLNALDLQKFAIPIGSALTALDGCENEIDFRQNEFIYPHPWKRYKIPLTIYMALCICLSAAVYFLGNAYIKIQDDDLRMKFSELLQSMNKPYTAFDNEYTSKLAGKTTVEEKEATPIENLDEEDILGRVRYLEKQLKSLPDTYPLLPNIPTVSDFFAWLATHPNVVSKDPKTGALNPLLQIENLTYTIVKRPEVTKKQEKYQVKIELEFSSPTPKLAREFHDSLISPNSMVDPKGDVKWSTNRGLYRASFFLKDKTVYSPS